MTQPFSTHIVQSRAEHDLDSDTKKVKIHGEDDGGDTYVAKVDSAGNLYVAVSATEPHPVGGASDMDSVDGASVGASFADFVTNSGTASTAVYAANSTDAEVEVSYGSTPLIRLGPNENVFMPLDIGSANLGARHTGTPPSSGDNVTATVVR